MDDAQKLSALFIQNQTLAQTFYITVKWVFLKITAIVLEVPATIPILQLNLVSQRKGELKDQGKNESLNTCPLISIGSMGDS